MTLDESADGPGELPPAEQTLAQRWGVHLENIVVEVQPGSLAEYLERNPALTGVLSLEEVEGGLLVHAAVRPGLAPARRERFATWVDVKIDRFIEHGREPDGWQTRSDGGAQLWAREVELPPI